jgi:hypothetical protein
MTVLAAGSYPLGGVLWTMLVFFAWILWFWLLFMVYADLFSRRDIGGGAKTAWVIFTLFLPYLGVLVYLIAQGRGMGERRVAAAQRQRAEMDDYVRSVVANSGTGPSTNGHGQADELSQAKALLDSGAITADEYEALKRKVLA